MAYIDDTIALGVRPPVVQSPLDSLSKGVSVMDMLSQLQERQAMAPLRQAQTQAAMLRAQSEQKQLQDQAALNSAFQSSVTYNDDLGDIDYDQDKGAQSLKDANKEYLLPEYQAQIDQRRTAHRQQAINEANAELARTQQEGDIAENFLAIPEDKRADEYPQLRNSLAKIDKTLALKLPEDYDPSIADNLQKVVTHRDTIENVQQKLASAQQRENLQQVTDLKTLTPQQIWEKSGGTGPVPPQFQREIAAKKAGVANLPASAYATKRLATNVDASGVADEDRIDDKGKTLANTGKLDMFQTPDGGVYYKPAAANVSGAQFKAERIEKAYAFATGKTWHGADWTPKDATDADAWYQRMTPQKQTEFDKRLGLYEQSPTTYAALFGHGGPQGDKAVTQAQKATILGRINSEITKQGLTGAEADQFKAQRFQELKDAGIDMGSSGAAAPPKPAAAQYGPTQTMRTTVDKPGLPKGSVITVHKNLATGKWEQVTGAQ